MASNSHNPYFNRLTFAIQGFANPNEIKVRHNPYFNRLTFAILGGNMELKRRVKSQSLF